MMGKAAWWSGTTNGCAAALPEQRAGGPVQGVDAANVRVEQRHHRSDLTVEDPPDLVEVAGLHLDPVADEIGRRLADLRPDHHVDDDAADRDAEVSEPV